MCSQDNDKAGIFEYESTSHNFSNLVLFIKKKNWFSEHCKVSPQSQ